MSELPLVDWILKYTHMENTLLCMPGHKGGAGFLRTVEGTKLYNNLISCDITEVDGADNLHHPESIIKEAQERLAEYYGAKKSYFLVNGSTSGNLAMIYSSFNEGDKVLVERNCHRSIFNGIIMRKLNPVYIKNEINKDYDAPMSIDINEFIKLIDDNRDAKGIIITYPNYYGIATKLKVIVEEAHKRNMKVLVDSAHGAHFGVHENIPENAVKLGADMVVLSCHKTLPSLTQAAYLCVNNLSYIDKVNFYVSAFLSTSPSYMLMCSMDYARYYMQKFGHDDYERLLKTAEVYREKINNIKHVHILGSEDIKEEVDLTRYVINIEKGYSSAKVYSYLLDRHIQPEMEDGRNIVLIFSPFYGEKEYEQVYNALKECDFQQMKEEYSLLQAIKIPKKKLLPYETLDKPTEWINIEEAENRICALAVVPYPPGVPIITLGEIVDIDIINVLLYYLKTSKTILGVNDKKILVLER